MTQITGGFIEYSEQREPNVFGSPKATARFDFGVVAGDAYETVAGKAANEARTYVRKLIGLQAAGAVEARAVATDAGSPATAASTAPATEPAPTKPRRGAPKDATPASAPAATAPGSAADIAAVVEPAPAPKAAPAVDEVVDDFMMAATPAPAKPISDVEINDVCKKAVARLGGGPEHRQKVLAYGLGFIPEGKSFSIANIPQEKRAAFVVGLAELK